MGRKKRMSRTTSTSGRKNVQHILPRINLSDDSNEAARVSPGSPTQINSIDRLRMDHLDIDEDETLHEQPEQEIILSSDEEEVNSESETTNFSNQSQKRKTNNDNQNMQKRTRKLIYFV